MESQAEYKLNFVEEIDAMLDKLKTARESSDTLKEERKAMVEQVTETPAYQALIKAGLETDDAISNLEKNIREMSLALWNASSELPERVTVKQFTVVAINNTLEAIAWCKSNFLPALALNTKVFEKAAKDGSIPAELATVSKEARAQIATKL